MTFIPRSVILKIRRILDTHPRQSDVPYARDFLPTTTSAVSLIIYWSLGKDSCMTLLWQFAVECSETKPKFFFLANPNMCRQSNEPIRCSRKYKEGAKRGKKRALVLVSKLNWLLICRESETFQPIAYGSNANACKIYVRVHVKITRQWKSTLS